MCVRVTLCVQTGVCSRLHGFDRLKEEVKWLPSTKAEKKNSKIDAETHGQVHVQMCRDK